MIEVTSRAEEYLTLLLERVEATGDQGLRLFPEETGTLGIALENLDEVQEGDEILGNEQRVVLVVDSCLAEILSGATLDCVTTRQGDRLVLDTS